MINSSPLYKELLLDHYQHPRNYGKLEDPHIVTGLANPSCGDQLSFYIQIDNEKIEKILFQGTGCVISQATASLLTVYLLGKELSLVHELSADILIELIGISLGPVRLKCALLSVEALQIGLKEYKHA